MKRHWCAVIALCATVATAQQAPTAEQDHADMLRQLGITRLRPGLSGDETAAAHVNYDEARANPHPNWPDPLRFDDGRPVRTAADWPRRRAEIARHFEDEIVGHVPATAPAISWSALDRNAEVIGGQPVTVERLTGRADNRAFPAIEVAIGLTLILPAQTSRQGVPLLIMFASPRFVTPADPRVATLIAAGWGVALLDTGTVQADTGAGLRAGVIGLANRGRPRAPGDWGALRAWGWGASRALDHLLTRPEIDGARIGIEGVSRWGKAAMVTAAFDTRFSAVLIGSAGEGGISPYGRSFGEALENLASSGGYHWFAGAFLRYAADAPQRRTAADLPVDAHHLLSLIAPRPAFVSYGIPAAGDAKWLDQQGSFMATVAAGKVWRLLGARDLGRGDDYQRAVMPPVNTGLLDGTLAWRQHDGGHTDAPNIAHFIRWAEAQWALRPPAAPAPAPARR
jgi:hypothetical protein